MWSIEVILKMFSRCLSLKDFGKSLAQSSVAFPATSCYLPTGLHNISSDNSSLISSYFPRSFQLHAPLWHSVCHGCCPWKSSLITQNDDEVSSSDDDADTEESYPDEVELESDEFLCAFNRFDSLLAATLALVKLHCPNGSHPFLSPFRSITAFLMLEWAWHPYILTTLISTSPVTSLLRCIVKSNGLYFFLQTGIPIFR